MVVHSRQIHVYLLTCSLRDAYEVYNDVDDFSSRTLESRSMSAGPDECYLQPCRWVSISLTHSVYLPMKSYA